VLLATIILGLGSATLTLATARCISVIVNAKHYSNAQRLIHQVDAENPLTRGELDEGVESGDFEDGYSWEREITQDNAEDRPGLYTIRTRVSWSMRGKPRYEEVVSWRYIKPEETEKRRR
jgi:hypothetical protein